MPRPLILVTNDDGMFAPGIKALIEVASELGEIVVVAPDSPQSGQGHAITLTEPLRINKVDVFPGIEAYECSGTPVDCVKIAKNVILKNRKIDFCVSGVNHGSNASINIIYSGTMSAAMEASIEGIPSIGFSYLDYSFEANFSAVKYYAKQIISKCLDARLGQTMLLNVNIPILKQKKIKGIKICKQAKGTWTEEFMEAKDPRDQTYYWLTGSFKVQSDDQDTDIWALDNGYISVVPCIHDLTNHAAISSFRDLEI